MQLQIAAVLCISRAVVRVLMQLLPAGSDA